MLFPPPKNVFLHIHRLALSILRISVQIPFQSVLAHPIYNSSSSSHTSSSSCLSTMQLVLACCVTHPWVLSACPSCNGNLEGQRLLQTITPSNTRMMSEVQAWDENCWVIQNQKLEGPLETSKHKRNKEKWLYEDYFGADTQSEVETEIIRWESSLNHISNLMMRYSESPVSNCKTEKKNKT